MPQSNPQSGYPPLRQTDLKDPTLFALNQRLQFLYSQLAGSSASGSGAWQSYVPTITGNGSMTVSSVTLGSAAYLTTNGMTFLALDISCTIGGTLNNALTISFPANAQPSSPNTVNVFACAINNGGLIGGVAVLTANTISVTAYDGTNYAAGSCEVTINGWYRT